MPEDTTAAVDGSTQVVKRETDWINVLFYIHLHLGALYGFYLALTQAYYATSIFSLLLGSVALVGVTSGAHRLYAHRTYTAAWPLRLFLVTCQTIVGQGSVYDWVLEHRLHHAHYGTNADPFNHNRGFLYAQLRCRLQAADPETAERAKAIDMSDMEADPIVMIQKRFYWVLMPILCWLLPINTPADYWGETIFNSVMIAGILRYTLVLHLAWLVNSAVTVWGLKPGDKYPSDTNMVFLVTKSHWPQYHYLLPWDYRSGEYGSYGTGCSTAFIRVWAALGWAYQLRTIDDAGVQNAIGKTVDTGKSLPECLNEEGELAKARMEQQHYLNPSQR